MATLPAERAGPTGSPAAGPYGVKVDRGLAVRPHWSVPSSLIFPAAVSTASGLVHPPTAGSRRVVTDARGDGPGGGWDASGRDLDDLLTAWGSEQTGPWSRRRPPSSGRHSAPSVATFGH